MTRSIAKLLPVNPETLGDMVGAAMIGVATFGMLWLTALAG